MESLTLNNWTEQNAVAVAVDHLVDHLRESLTDLSLDHDLNGVRYVAERLVAAAMLKERLDAMKGTDQ